MSSIEFNPFTGSFDFVGSSGGGVSRPDNFSYRQIPSGTTVTLPSGQEMLLKSPLVNQGLFINKGIVRFVIDDNEQIGNWNRVPAGRSAFVPANKTMFFKSLLRVQGVLRNNGIVESV